MIYSREFSVNQRPEVVFRIQGLFPEPAIVQIRKRVKRTHAELAQHSSIYLEAVPEIAGIYGRRDTDPGFRNRRNYGNFHHDPRGDVAFLARF